MDQTDLSASRKHLINGADPIGKGAFELFSGKLTVRAVLKSVIRRPETSGSF
ncbi:MAG: hypothetical protein ACI8X5_002789 [Planctomycetota bacterium]